MQVGLPLSYSVRLTYPVPASQTLLFPDPRPLVERLGENFFRQLTKRPGVYLMRDAAEAVLYVGKARNLRQRLGHYRVANPDRMGRRHLRLLRLVVRIELLECADETAALAREAELLRALKPKFNRAGVWSGPPRFLVWRMVEDSLQLANTKTSTTGWREFGPCGSGVVYLRGALVRLLWYALNPSLGSTCMPAGWWQGRLPAIATIGGTPAEVEWMLAKSFAGDTDELVRWIGDRTESLAYAYDRDVRDADLETVVTLIRARLRRTLPFQAVDLNLAQNPGSSGAMLLFSEDDWNGS